MFEMPGKINTVEANFGPVSEARRAEIEQALLGAVGDNYQMGALSGNAELLTNLTVGQSIFSILGVLALLMGGFIIFNTFRTIVVERRRDIGMLRAVGASRGTILGQVLTEGLVQGVIGTALGLGLGYLLAYGLMSLLSPMLHRFMNVSAGRPVVTPALLVGSIVLGVGVTLVAGLVPALAASRLSPLEALRPAVGRISLRRMAGIGFWAGVAMLVLAVAALLSKNLGLLGLGAILFVVGLVLTAPALITPIANLFGGLAAMIFARGGTAQLAEGNLSRQPSRATITASTTLIGMAIMVLAGSMMSSVVIGFERVMRKSLGSDYVLIPPSIAVWGTNVGAGPELAQKLRGIDGVEVVSGLRFAPTTVNGSAVSLLAIDPATYPLVSGLNFSKGDEGAYQALDAGRNLIANPVLASVVGLEVGDEVELQTPTGPQTYRVVAVGGDYLNSKITTAYIGQANLAADFSRTEDILLQVNLKSGADRAAVEAGLRQALAAYPQFRMINGQAYIEENLKIFNAAFAGLVALVLFLAVPSLIAMVNTLAIGVLERTREIGMLRAVGATRGQVRTVVLVEALILSAIGTVLGVLSGLYMGYLLVAAMKAFGYPMEYAFPIGGVLLALAAGLVFGALAAIVPARQASRLPIVQALRYE
jgi:putative ABC transport system permease protein